jgi:hypothetical protein
MIMETVPTILINSLCLLKTLDSILDTRQRQRVDSHPRKSPYTNMAMF